MGKRGSIKNTRKWGHEHNLVPSVYTLSGQPEFLVQAPRLNSSPNRGHCTMRQWQLWGTRQATSSGFSGLVGERAGSRFGRGRPESSVVLASPALCLELAGRGPDCVEEGQGSAKSKGQRSARGSLRAVTPAGPLAAQTRPRPRDKECRNNPGRRHRRHGTSCPSRGLSVALSVTVVLYYEVAAPPCATCTGPARGKRPVNVSVHMSQAHTCIYTDTL